LARAADHEDKAKAEAMAKEIGDKVPIGEITPKVKKP
jgi:hypothetical protein